MKKSILSLTLLFLLMFFPIIHSAQTVDLELFPGLAELQIGSIISANGVINTQRYLNAIIYEAADLDVQIEIKVEWKKDINSDRRFVARALTKAFRVESDPMKISNLDIGSRKYQLEESTYNDEALDDLRKLGKLAGQVYVKVRLFLPDGRIIETPEGIIGILNPASTLTINSPTISSSWNEGNIPMQWNSISGAADYLVRCNTKKPFEDNEEGLKSGEPLLWEESVIDFFPGLKDLIERGETDIPLNINLWDMFGGTRVPTPGSEVVVQLIGVIPSTSVDNKIESPIVNFYINDPQTQRSPEQTQQFVSSMRSYVSNSNLTPQEQEDLNSFLDLVETGQVSYNGVRDGSGNIIPAREVQRILTYLQDNPDMIVLVKKR